MSQEIVHTRALLSRAHPGTPPTSPNLQSSESIDILKAVLAMQIATSPVAEHLEQLIAKIVEAKLTTSAGKSEDPKPVAPGDNELEDVEAEASRLEFKTVDEVWNEKAHKYTIVKSLEPEGKIKEQALYVFVVRHRVDKDTKDTTTYIDLKSTYLRDILRVVLQNVRGISLKEDKLSVEQNLLYNHLPELDLCYSLNNVYPVDNPYRDHLELLIDYITETYADVTQHLTSLLQGGEITYDLLWALFKSNAFVYTTCSGTLKPRCVRYNFGEEKRSGTGAKYWSLDCRYLDFNGEVFGSVPIELKIPKFRGTRRINALEAFPFQYHADVRRARADLLACGRKFMSLIGSHYRYCRGKAFIMCDGEQVKVPIDSRIMIDAAFFRKMNPNYYGTTVIDLADGLYVREAFEFSSNTSSDEALSDTSSDQDSSDTSFDLASSDTSSNLAASKTSPNHTESNTVELAQVIEDDFITCCPTVPGFSFSDKLWAEFAVDDIEDIRWSSLPFDCLSIPDEQRDVVMALVEAHNDPSVVFDDVITRKGKGLNILLHGKPGVGKTLTAEAVAELLKRALYSISAGELPTDAAKLEVQLSRIFKIASHWNAILLLDEADVFLEQRSSENLVRNSLVSVFLRKLEYCEGIMFLTTNRVTQFDIAILSRIHVMLRYGDLSRDAGKKVWALFIKTANTPKGAAKISSAELQLLANSKLNGRQIKNIMATAQALAAKEKSRVCFFHIRKTISASKEFISEFNGGAEVDHLYL